MSIDSNFGTVRPLLHFNGADGSTTITDSSSYALTATAPGGAVISTAKSKWGGSSLLLNGTTSWVNFGAAPALGDITNYTVECDINPTALPASKAGIFFSGDSTSNNHRVQFEVNSDGTLTAYYQAGTGTGVSFTTTATVAVDAWTHVALCKQGTSIYVLVGGARSASGTYSTTITGNSNLRIGVTRSASTLLYFNGHIDNFRLTVGVARYTGTTYAVPTEEFSELAYASASGFSTTQFGVPYSTDFVGTPGDVNTSIVSTAFGTPYTPGVTGTATSITSSSFGTPKEMGFNWPGGSFPDGWTSQSGQPPWEYDPVVGGQSPGSLAVTGTSIGTLISPFYALPYGGELSLYLKKSLSNAAYCSVIFQATGHADYEVPFTLFSSGFTKVSSGWLPPGNWRVQVVARLSFSGGTPTTFWADDFSVAGELQVSAGISSTQFGIPQLEGAFQAASIASSQLGTPALFIPTKHYVSVPRSKFGVPTAFGISQPCFAEGFQSTRFAKPRVFPPTAYIAQGWISSRFGTAKEGNFSWRITYNQITRARPLRATQFGTPTSP